MFFEEEAGSVEDDTTGKHSVFNDLLFSNCEFDVQTFNQYLNEFGDEESEQHKHCPDHNCNSDDEKSDESDFFCDCLVEAVPLYHTNIMRETGGKLRGLLKPANRPPPARKNRVVFDETRNEFFEADYIILIREDCPYDEEDEEPCTCGDHELVRICCDEGCNCGYTDDGRTPPVSYVYLALCPIRKLLPFDIFTLDVNQQHSLLIDSLRPLSLAYCTKATYSLNCSFPILCCCLFTVFEHNSRFSSSIISHFQTKINAK